MSDGYSYFIFFILWVQGNAFIGESYGIYDFHDRLSAQNSTITFYFNFFIFIMERESFHLRGLGSFKMVKWDIQ